jgi:gliding motility-associated protein GldC
MNTSKRRSGKQHSNVPVICSHFPNYYNPTSLTFAVLIKLFYMHTSNISIEIELDENKVPQQIQWTASDSSADMMQPAKSMMVAFWDGADKSALRIDLWTKDMMVDEMADFYYQTMMGMADTYLRATQQKELVADMKNFAKDFYKKFKDSQLKENQ